MVFEYLLAKKMFTFKVDGKITQLIIIHPYKKNVPKEISDTIPEEWGIG